MLILRVLKSPPHPHLRNHNCICHAIIIKSFTSIARLRAKNLPPRRKIEENELEEKFIRGCGPGGQKINKTSSAVHLRHIPSGLQIKTQVSRSQALNRKFARRLLADKVEQMEKGSESRVEMKAEIKKKKKASKMKKTRRKYGSLREEEEAQSMREDEGGEGKEEDENEVEEEEGDEKEETKERWKEGKKQERIKEKKKANEANEAEKKDTTKKEAEENEAKEETAKEKKVKKKEKKKEKKIKEKEAKEKEAKEKEMREKEMRKKEAREKEAREKEAREKEVKEKEAMEQAAIEKAAKEQEAIEKAAKEKKAKEREEKNKATKEREKIRKKEKAKEKEEKLKQFKPAYFTFDDIREDLMRGSDKIVNEIITNPLAKICWSIPPPEPDRELGEYELPDWIGAPDDDEDMFPDWNKPRVEIQDLRPSVGRLKRGARRMNWGRRRRMRPSRNITNKRITDRKRPLRTITDERTSYRERPRNRYSVRF